MKIHKSVLKRNITALHLDMLVSAKFFLQFKSEESNAEKRFGSRGDITQE